MEVSRSDTRYVCVLHCNRAKKNLAHSLAKTPYQYEIEQIPDCPTQYREIFVRATLARLAGSFRNGKPFEVILDHIMSLDNAVIVVFGHEDLLPLIQSWAEQNSCKFRCWKTCHSVDLVVS